METTLLIIVIVLVVGQIGLNAFLLLAKKENQNGANEFKNLEQEVLVKMAQQIGDLKEHMAVSLAQSDKQSTASFIAFSQQTSKTIDEQIERINKKVDQRLGEGFEKTNKTFESVIERLAKIDEAQKNIETLSTEVVSLSNVLTDKSSRGLFGEVQLEHIFETIFGPNKPEIYQKQYQLKNGNIADMVLFAPEPLGTICIDSKFPLENYRLMLDQKLDKTVREQAEKRFNTDVRRHIDDISKKYISKGETANQAIMFVPAEAIFAEIGAHHESLVNYAYNKRVVMTSPTTIMYTLSLVHVILRDIERNKYADEIKEELDKLSEEFNHFVIRWDRINKNIATAYKNAGELEITSKKIVRRFEQISKVDKDLLVDTDKEVDQLEMIDEN